MWQNICTRTPDQIFASAFCFLTSTFYLLPSAFSDPRRHRREDRRIPRRQQPTTWTPPGPTRPTTTNTARRIPRFLTIKRAVDAAVRDKDANVGAKIIIAPGTYRESIDIPAPADKAPDTDAPLVIEAAERDQTIIDAADAAGWEAQTPGSQARQGTTRLIAHPWPSG